MRKKLKKILIIDDSKTTIELLRNSLIEKDYDVDFVYDGLSGIARAETYTPDLIILDIIMPQMDGLSCLLQLRLNESTSGIPVIIYTEKGYMRELFEHKEIAAFIEKTSDHSLILQTIHQQLN